ncbi:MAG: heavy metal-binding domain-containing protein [Fidelibacterota bacterium]
MPTRQTISIISILFLALAVTACGQKKNQPVSEKKSSMEMSGGKMEHDMSGMDMKDTKGTEKVAYYTCPMESHSGVHSDEPGKCPECGMKLVKVVETTPENADFWGCPKPDLSNVRSDNPGK